MAEFEHPGRRSLHGHDRPARPTVAPPLPPMSNGLARGPHDPYGLGYEDGETSTLDHVREAYWLIPKPGFVCLWNRFWRVVR